MSQFNSWFNRRWLNNLAKVDRLAWLTPVGAPSWRCRWWRAGGPWRGTPSCWSPCPHCRPSPCSPPYTQKVVTSNVISHNKFLASSRSLNSVFHFWLCSPTALLVLSPSYSNKHWQKPMYLCFPGKKQNCSSFNRIFLAYI